MRTLAVILLIVSAAGCGGVTLRGARSSCVSPPFFQPPATTPSESWAQAFAAISRAASHQRCLAAERRERATRARVARLERELAELRAAVHATAAAPAASAAAASATPGTRPAPPYCPAATTPPANPFDATPGSSPVEVLAPNPY